MADDAEVERVARAVAETRYPSDPRITVVDIAIARAAIAALRPAPPAQERQCAVCGQSLVTMTIHASGKPQCRGGGDPVEKAREAVIEAAREVEADYVSGFHLVGSTRKLIRSLTKLDSLTPGEKAGG